MTLLETQQLTIQFGGLVAVDHVDLHVAGNEIVGLIGPNGAGKTTMFNAITGLYHPTAGRILFKGKVINELKPHQRVLEGISRTFQGIRLFPSLTVAETVEGACLCRLERSQVDHLLCTARASKEIDEIRQRSLDILEMLGLKDLAHREAAGLPYGFQRRLEIARALATRPRVLLLDEPAAGMNPSECNDLMAVIRSIKDMGIPVLLVEHHMRVVMGICDRIVVLNYGKKIADGKPEEVRANRAVVEAYLGGQTNGTA